MPGTCAPPAVRPGSDGLCSAPMAHYIMQMEDVQKVYDQTVIIENLTLSFYYGAKIGMLGKNGAGKSTLLRIMAGEDAEFEGKLWHHPGTRIGHVSQEPVVEMDKTVRRFASMRAEATISA